MEEIIEQLGNLKRYYESDILIHKKDLERQQGYIQAAEERIADIEDKLNSAQAFIDQYDAAIEVLRNAS